MTDVLVVGGGNAGLSAAVHSLELGAQVTVIERSHPPVESTGASAVVFTTSSYNDLDVSLRVWSLDCLQRWRTEMDIPFVSTGFLRLARNSTSRDLLSEVVDTQRRFGVADAVMLGPADLKTLIPHLDVNPRLSGSWCPSAGYSDGRAMSSSLAKFVRGHGGRITRGEVVAHHKARHHMIELSDGATHTADVIINAAGAWAPSVGQLLGQDIDLITEHRQLMFIKPSHGFGYAMPFVMDDLQGGGKVGVYFRQAGGDRLLAGLYTNPVGIHEKADPADFTRRIDDSFLEEVGDMIVRLLPDLRDAGLQPGYTGVDTSSPDGLPIVGPFADDPTIIACTGGTEMLTPIMGRLAAEYATGHTEHCVPHSNRLLPARFQIGSDGSRSTK